MPEDQGYFSSDYIGTTITKVERRKSGQEADRQNIDDQTASIEADLRAVGDQTEISAGSKGKDKESSSAPTYAINPENSSHGLIKPTRRVLKVRVIDDEDMRSE